MVSQKENKKRYALALLIVVSILINHADGETIGVCYGMLVDSMPSKSDVVNLLKSRNIGKARLYEANRDALEALKGSGIEVIVGVGNTELQKIAGDQAAANGWVNDNIVPFASSVTIKYIAVGNEVYANKELINYLLPAMNNIQTAMRNANLQNIKVSTPHAASVLSNSFPPFSGKVLALIWAAILKFLSDNGSLFMGPSLSILQATLATRNSISLDYALFRSTNPIVNDGGRMYNNLFDAMVDSFIFAMEKLGYPKIPIVITESGWPSAGTDVATVDNAGTYNNNLIKHVFSSDGTPKRPGNTIETYIFALFNENMKSGSEEERHFGLFETNKNPVYPVNFSP
uniref:Glucanase-like protein n=1 Tax=Thuja occidentalis TaxID=3317 RepID=Q5RZ68_THUOC|nr:glucanase-like protein [Thuja occidentalis]